MIDHSGHAHPSTKAARAACRAGGGTSSKDGTVKTAAPPKKAVKKVAKKAIKKTAPKKTTRPRVKKTVKKKTPSGPARSPRVQGRDLTDTVAADATALYDAMSEAHPATDGGLTEIARRQGWMAPARVTDRAGVDAAVAAGATVIWRGVQPSPARGGFPALTQAQLLDQMRDDPDWALGTGVYGNGSYFSSGPATAEEFAQEEEDELTGTVRGAISPEARVAEHEDLKREHREWLQNFISDNQELLDQNPFTSPEVDRAHHMKALMSDPGRFAAMMGYDVIHIPEGYDDGGDDSAQYIILNRTVLILEDEP